MKQGKRHVVISVDYEIFGNGSGDVRSHVIEPTSRMAAICEKFGAPLTVFFEVEEYLAFERCQADLEKELGYNPAREIKEQIIDLARRGHDIQLHLHPDWYGARYERGEWILNRENRSVDDLFESAEETIDYIGDRKATIEEMLSEAGIDRSVSAYRAGAFWAQPGSKLLTALAANNIVIDSSVVYGMFRTIGGRLLDFRNAPRNRRHWRVREEVIVEDATGPVWEIPIYSRQLRRFRQITWKRLKAKFSRQVPLNKQKETVEHMGISGPWALIRFLFEVFPEKFDYHNQSPQKLVRWAHSALPPEEGEIDVLVSIGHTKEHMDDAPFEEFVAKASASSQLKIVGLDEVARLLPADSTRPEDQESPPRALYL